MSFGLGGNGGDGIEGNNSFHSSWYIGPDELQRYIDAGNYPAEEMEGCWLVDKIALLEQKPGLAFTSPMVNPLLKPEQVDRLQDRDHMKDTFTATLLTEFTRAGWGALVLSGAYGGLDFVSPDIYVKWWAEKGALIGRVIDGKVTWS